MKATPDNMKRCEAAQLRAISYCRDCGAEFSATAGDYWNADPTKPLMCCDAPMVLVTREPIYRNIRLPRV